jgi:purine-binding chemotaxis protein CheW
MMLQALAARDGRDAVPPPGTAADTAASWLLCRAGTMLCAMPVEQVIEIMRVLPLEPFAGAPPCVLGLSIVRGAPVPVVDIGLIVGGVATRAARLVTVNAAGRIIALAMAEVIGITGIAAAAFERLPPLLQDAAADTVTAIGTLDSELIVFLRASRLVPEDVFALLDAGGTAA